MYKPQIDPVPRQRFSLFRPGHLKSRQTSPRIARHEFLHHARKIMKRSAGFEADHQRIARPPSHVSRGLNRPFMLIQRPACLLDKSRARRRESNIPLSPLYQRGADNLFETLNLSRKSRLRYTQLQCRLAEMQILRQRGKIPKLTQTRIAHLMAHHNIVSRTWRRRFRQRTFFAAIPKSYQSPPLSHWTTSSNSP